MLVSPNVRKVLIIEICLSAVIFHLNIVRNCCKRNKIITKFNTAERLKKTKTAFYHCQLRNSILC